MQWLNKDFRHISLSMFYWLHHYKPIYIEQTSYTHNKNVADFSLEFFFCGFFPQ